MKYFIDCKFIEGKQDKRILGIKYSETKPIIDLISIALVASDGREYYAISKDFDIKAAWNNEWIRENILKPIWDELGFREKTTKEEFANFNCKVFKSLVNKYGKSNSQIAEEIKPFVYNHPHIDYIPHSGQKDSIEFYAYYADYDWVVFCQLFGRMIDLPKGFPMYCRDIKQILDEKQEKRNAYEEHTPGAFNPLNIKERNDYPKQDPKTEHHALYDARFDKELYQYLMNL